ncbi:non-hydrolyzing UDP-N-acetylglucosamine 2-epimerase [Propionivibrio sp.]|uniref:non-hydrolyzing UDP-N-acetylglucosamine 2-epimerase n=1 Tax=Propionivibrio sp. TaxID=2212460 RepID=UPI0039E39D20
MIKIVTIVGARPQFIKAAAISRAICDKFSDRVSEVLVHTGQHFDANMSKVFFDELDIPEPKYNLEISGGQHGAMTGRMLEAVEKVLLDEHPDWVLVYGDTNSTLAGALAAVKLHIPVAHVEAGLRSFNMRMPEEVNRIVSDRISTLLFCPTETAVGNLVAEGITAGVSNVGDVMFDVAMHYRQRAREQSRILDQLDLQERSFVLTTCHRAENTNDHQRLRQIVEALARLSERFPVVLPVHPRTRKLLVESGLDDSLGRVRITDPMPFMDMVALEQAAKVILTDSGGVQKEAFFYGVPCVTMRDETEWTETISARWNVLVGADTDKIVSAVIGAKEGCQGVAPYGNGKASVNIVEALVLASGVSC